MCTLLKLNNCANCTLKCNSGKEHKDLANESRITSLNVSSNKRFMWQFFMQITNAVHKIYIHIHQVLKRETFLFPPTQ